MSPFSTPVLLGAALLSSPALWRSLTGHMRLEVGISRYLIAVVICWLALALFVSVVGPAPRQTAEPEAASKDEPAEHDLETAGV
jgi:hypothetical protein